MQREYKISLSQEFYSDVVYLSQYDSDYDVIFKVMNKHSAVDVNGKSAKFTGTRKDGLGFTFEAVGIGSYVSFEINTSLTAVAGHHTAEIVFYDSQGLYFGSANVQVVVEPAARKDGTIDADTKRAQEIAEEIQEIVDTAAAEVKGEAESWAVGERDGEPVPATDPTYQNNAKFYAEQAQEIADSIGIDATLSVSGKAADAKKTGDEISSLKEDLNSVFNDNLVGNELKLYPVDIAPGGKFTVSTSDGSVFPTDSTLQILLYDSDKKQLDYFSLKNGNSSRTMTTNASLSATKYLAWNELPSVPLMVNHGSTAKPYKPYVTPIRADVDALTNGNYVLKEPRWVDGYYVNYSSGARTADNAYKYAQYDVSAFRGLHIVGSTACAPNSYQGIALYDANLVYLGGVRPTTAGSYAFDYDITLPNNVKFIRISLRKASTNLWADPVILGAKSVGDLMIDVNGKVNTLEKSLIIRKDDLSVGNLQASAFVIGEYDTSVIYYHKIPVAGGTRVRVESPDIDGVAEKHYRFAQYKASDGSYKTTTSDTTSNTYQIDSDCGYFAFSFSCKESGNAAIHDLYTRLPEDFTFRVVTINIPKGEYTDSTDVENLIGHAITDEYITHGLNGKLRQAARTINVSGNAYKSEVQPVVILHFSDIHGDAVELYRMLKISEMYDKLIDDAICTGDICETRWADGIDFWTQTDGAENILIAIGNHDALTDPSGYDWTQLAAQSDQYNRYIAPFVANWDCTCTAGKTYYYKDYATKKLRLIVLNCMLTGDDASAQLTWFSGVLDGALSNEYSVVVATHYMIEFGEKVDCNFTSLDHVPAAASVLPVAYETAVKTFVDNGGKFVCYIAGHTHYDMIIRGTDDYSNQFCFVVDALSRSQGNQYSDTQRTDGTDSQDLANLLVFDTARKAIKIIRIGANMDSYLRAKNAITINYETGEIISQN